MDKDKEEVVRDYVSLVSRGLTAVFTFFIMLFTGYIAYVLYRFVQAMQQIAENLQNIGN